MSPTHAAVPNVGTAPATITSILEPNKTLSNPENLSLGFARSEGDCIGVLEIGASCTFEVWVAAESIGPATAFVLVNGTHPGQAVEGELGLGVVNLSATGVDVFTEVDLVQFLDFGTVPVGAAATRTLTVSNDSAVPLDTSSALGVVTDYRIAATTCGPALAAGASCTIDVEVVPTTTGRVDGRLDITVGGNDGIVARTFQVVLVTGLT